MTAHDTLREMLAASLATVPAPSTAAETEYARLRRYLEHADAETRAVGSAHTRRAYGLPTRHGQLGKPRRWVEPSLTRDEALSEARRFAEESPCGTGFAWLATDRWYAADERPGIADEIVSIEILGGRETETNEGATPWA